MKLDLQNIGKSLAPSVMSRALQAFDRATMVVVSLAWGTAIVVLGFALYTVNLSVIAKRAAIEAAAREPSVPKIINNKPEKAEMKNFVQRLQKRFPDITFNAGNDQSLMVIAVDASKFRLWLTVLSYIDTMSAQYRWTIKEFCVGSRCEKGTPMRALLTAEKISFSATGSNK